MPLLLEARRRLGADDEHLICPEPAVTSKAARLVVHDNSEPLSDAPPVRVLPGRPDRTLRWPEVPGRFLGRDLAVLLGGSAVVIVLAARMVAAEEARLCVDTTCNGETPTTFWVALY